MRTFESSRLLSLIALLALVMACAESGGGRAEEDTGTGAPVATDSEPEPSVSEAPSDSGNEPSTDESDSPQPETFENPYAPCTDDTDCEEGLECLTVRQQPKWGQCTRRCEPGDACPAPPDQGTQQVGCYEPGGGLCTIVCGQFASECPDWLECLSMEVCLEPTNQVPTQEPGEGCSEPAQCKGESDCVQLGVNPAYCSPLCEVDDDCAVPAKSGASAGLCTEIPGAGYKFCMFQCPPFAPGTYCPGDLKCTAGLCL